MKKVSVNCIQIPVFFSGMCTSVRATCVSTVSKAVDPVVAKVHPQEGEPPGPGRVPGQLHQAVPVPHIYVSSQLTASHQQPEGGTVRALCHFTVCVCICSSCYSCTAQCVRFTDHLVLHIDKDKIKTNLYMLL